MVEPPDNDVPRRRNQKMSPHYIDGEVIGSHRAGVWSGVDMQSCTP